MLLARVLESATRAALTLRFSFAFLQCPCCAEVTYPPRPPNLSACQSCELYFWRGLGGIPQAMSNRLLLLAEALS